MNTQTKRYIGRGLGRVMSAGVSVPVELGCVTLPVWMCSHPQSGSFLNPVLLGFYGGFLLINY